MKKNEKMKFKKIIEVIAIAGSILGLANLTTNPVEANYKNQDPPPSQSGSGRQAPRRRKGQNRQASTSRRATPPAPPVNSNSSAVRSSRSRVVREQNATDTNPIKLRVEPRKDKTEAGTAVQGLPNYGNSCFLNATLQLLLNNQDFVNFLLTTTDDELIVDVTHSEYAKIFHLLKTIVTRYQNHQPIGTDLLHNLFQLVAIGHEDLLNDYQQTDAQEFMSFLLDGLSCCLKNYDKLTNLYCVNSRSLIIGSDPESFEERSDHDAFLNLSPTRSTLQGCLGTMFEPEFLPDLQLGNGKVGATKIYNIINTPKLLLIHLSRYNYSLTAKKSVKNAKVVQIPVKFLANEICLGARGTYQLTSIIRHHGSSLSFGHYTADVKKGDQWYRISDSSVTKITEQQALDDSNGTIYLPSYTLINS